MLNFEFIGNLGGDAVVKQNKADGSAFISFTVAVSNKYRDRVTGEMREKTKWISCSRSGSQNVDAYLKKGVQVFVRGDVNALAYLDKTGKPAADLCCYVRELQLLGKAQAPAADQQQQQAAQYYQQQIDGMLGGGF